jgi:DNA helicase HerA-like ATPase
VLPPASQIGPITPEERKQLIQSSVVAGTYEKVIDRESAFERLAKRATASGAPAQPGAPIPTAGGTTEASAGGGILGGIGDVLFGRTGPRGGRHEGVVDAMAKSAARSMGSAVAREIARGVLGSLLGGRKR